MPLLPLFAMAVIGRGHAVADTARIRQSLWEDANQRLSASSEKMKESGAYTEVDKKGVTEWQADLATRLNINAALTSDNPMQVEVSAHAGGQGGDFSLGGIFDWGKDIENLPGQGSISTHGGGEKWEGEGRGSIWDAKVQMGDRKKGRADAGVLLAVLPFASGAQVDRGVPLVRRASLGAEMGAASTEELAKAGLGKAGEKVLSVLPGLTAEKLGVKAGDLLTMLDGRPISGPADIAAVTNGLFAGHKVWASVWRNGKKLDLSGSAVERPRQKAQGLVVLYDQVVSKAKRIRVIATHPEGKGPFPTVFFIGGVGAYSLDGNFESIPYGAVLGPIAKAGYATIRIDKPGQGDSEGPTYADLAFGDEEDAYLQALRLAKTLPFVDMRRIAIFGHSMGGVFAPLVDAREPVAGLAVNGTVVKTWVEYWLENTRRQSLLAGASAADVDRQAKSLAAVLTHVFYEGSSFPEVEAKFPDLADRAKSMCPDGKTMSGVGVKFFQELARQDVAEAWQKTDAEVLALWGENDFISTEWDHRFLVDIVNRHRAGRAQFKLLPGTDHGFNTTTSPKDSQDKWGRPGYKFNPAIVDALLVWLKQALQADQL